MCVVLQRPLGKGPLRPPLHPPDSGGPSPPENPRAGNAPTDGRARRSRHGPRRHAAPVLRPAFAGGASRTRQPGRPGRAFGWRLFSRRRVRQTAATPVPPSVRGRAGACPADGRDRAHRIERQPAYASSPSWKLARQPRPATGLRRHPVHARHPHSRLWHDAARRPPAPPAP